MGEETRAAVRAIETVERKDRVLIVEDEDNARKGYEQLLQRWGCDVVGVATAEEALAHFLATTHVTVFPPGSSQAFRS
jgi:PleD family two-component response regulator